MICMVDDCEAQVKARGLCQKHYMRQRRTGDASIARKPGRAGDSRKHPRYTTWAGMVNRCHNANNSAFNRYGAVGVYVCERWRHGQGGNSGFECFLHDMGDRPEGMTLDRIDPTGPYAPENCRWATSKDQRKNYSPDGVRRATTKGSAAKRTANYTAEGQRLYDAILMSGGSVNALAQRMGRGASFLFSVMRGDKQPSSSLVRDLSANGFEGFWPTANLQTRSNEPQPTSQK